MTRLLNLWQGNDDFAVEHITLLDLETSHQIEDIWLA